ncbi:MAG: hypothetical protein ACREOI_06945 [bacterium]
MISALFGGKESPPSATEVAELRRKIFWNLLSFWQMPNTDEPQ